MKLISLQTRRKLQSCIYLYKILHNHINDPITLGLISITISRPNSCNFMTFYCDISRTNYELRSPVKMLYSNFNSISCSVDIFGDLFSKFKNGLYSDYQF